MEKYNLICSLVELSKAVKSSEAEYEKHLKNVMEGLGWSEEKGNISFQEKIPVGTNSSLIPDAILSHNEENVVVIDFKKPTDSLGESYKTQITSYMKQLKLDYGILIGENIQLYYDNPNDEKNDPILIFESPFVKNYEETKRLVDLLKHDSFSVESLKQFCEEKIKEKEEDEEVQNVVRQLEEDGENLVSELLKRDLKQNTMSDRMIEKVLENIVINIQSKKNYETEQEIIEQNTSPVGQQKLERYRGPKLPIEFIPKDEELFKKLLLEKKYAIRRYHYEDGSSKEEIWNAQSFAETSGLRGNIRSSSIAREGKWKKQGIEKIVFIIEGYEKNEE